MDNMAKDKESYNFIINVLDIKPIEGKYFSEAKFNKSDLTKSEIKWTDIKVTLTKTSDNKDYAITDGTYNIQFFDGENTKGNKYLIKLKVDTQKGVIANFLTRTADIMVYDNTDVVTNPNILFVKNGLIPTGAIKGVKITIKDTGSTSINVDGFNGLNSLTGLKISAQMESTDPIGKWVTRKKLIISFKTNDVNFDPSTIKMEFIVS